MADESKSTADSSWPKRRLLLVSNSTNHGETYLEHCAPRITSFLNDAGAKNVLFFPYALTDRDDYEAAAKAKFAEMGFALTSLHSVIRDAVVDFAAKDQAMLDEHTASVAGRAIREADAFFIGGGNTFRLLKALKQYGILEAVQERARAGVPYIGTSAGTNVATWSIKTTNDMPITCPPSLDALQLVPFQINAHYLDPDPKSTHNGETREKRIAEFHEEAENKDLVVVGLREGSMLHVVGDDMTLVGPHPARIFVADAKPFEVPSGSTTSPQVCWKPAAGADASSGAAATPAPTAGAGVASTAGSAE